VPVDGNLDAAIAAVEARLRDLDSSREATARELAELRARRQQALSVCAGRYESSRTDSWTPQRKVELFASLFRGRPDVFPSRWERPAKGKSG
jgi:hypothetical protein